MLNTIIIENKNIDENELRKNQQPRRILPTLFANKEIGYGKIVSLP